MNLSSAIPILILTVGAIISESAHSASPAPQTSGSRSDSDINAVGHRNVGKGLNLYSLDREKTLGKQLASEVERASRLIDDPFVTAYLDRIEQNIAKNSDARVSITVRVIDSDAMNAFTLPGRFQYINSGLILRTEGEAELAGVLARGIAHTALRTSTMEATKGELMQLSTTPLMILGPGGWAGYGAYGGLDLSIPLTYLKFRRDSERAADYFGLQYLYKSGYDPECFPRFIERIWPPASADKSIPKVFSPFPPMPERLQNMHKEIAAILPGREGAIVSSSEFQEMKEHLRAWNSQKVFKPAENSQKPKLRKPTDDQDPHR